MEENKFEKRVHHKMEELKIQPSDSVWENVNSRIEKRKKRRWEFLALFLLAGALLTGGFWYFNSLNNSISKEKQVNNYKSNEQGIENSQLNKNNTDREKEKTQELVFNEKNISNSGPGEKNNSKSKGKKTASQNVVKGKNNKSKKPGNLIATINSPEAETDNFPVKNNNRLQTGNILNEPDEGKVSMETSAVVRNDLVQAENINKDSLINRHIAKKLDKQKDSLLNNIEKKKYLNPIHKNKWKVGFFIAGGISHIGNQFLGLGYANADYLQNSNGPGTGGSPIPGPSKVKNGRGFIGGVFLEKDISSKTKISFGINYKEFNTSNLVGQRNDTTGYYSARNTQRRYYNNFKFIELPVRLKVQLNKSKDLPVFWSGGITLSRFVNSNALQFNSGSGIYYKDNSLFNKTQIGLSTGLSAALFQNQKTSVLFGPYIYYSASQLANEGLYNKKHFVFFGLRTEIIFEKK